MKVVLDIKENHLQQFVDFIKKNNIQVNIFNEEDNLTEELKQALFEVKLIKNGILKEKSLSELIDEL